MQRIFLSLFLGLVLVGATEAQRGGGKPEVGGKGARILTWCFSGQFEQIPTEYRDLNLAIGDLVVGGLQIESNTPDTTPNDFNKGTYLPLRGFVYIPTLSIYSEFLSPSNAVAVSVIDGESDYFEIYLRTTSLAETENPTELFFFGGRLPPTTFTSKLLPSFPPAVEDFEFLNFQYTNYSISSGASTTGPMTTLFGISKRASNLRKACGA